MVEESCSVPVDWKSITMKQLIKAGVPDRISIRGWFIEKAINLEYGLIQILAQYCCEEYEEYNDLIHSLLKKEIHFDEIINIFKGGRVGIKSKLQKVGFDFDSFLSRVENVRDFRNFLAHGQGDDSENSIFTAEKEIVLTEDFIAGQYDTFKEVEGQLDVINLKFLMWDDKIVITKNWSHANTQEAHKQRSKAVKKTVKKSLNKYYHGEGTQQDGSLFEEFNKRLSEKLNLI